MKAVLASQEEFKQRQIDFVRTEIDTGITLAEIAGDSSEEFKRIRNRTNARRAYDTALKYMEGREGGTTKSE